MTSKGTNLFLRPDGREACDLLEVELSVDVHHDGLFRTVGQHQQFRIVVKLRFADIEPRRLEEVHHAKEEGIEFHLLENPVQILNDGNGQVCGIECLKMELGEPDASGRRSPIPIEGSNYVLDVDTVIMSLGTSPNPLIRKIGRASCRERV